MKLKKKRETISSMKKKVWAIFSPYIRLRDCLLTTDSSGWGECISCGQTKPYSELDAGHFVAKHSNNLFSERGTHAQCKHCNRHLHGNQLGYRRGLVELYGEEITQELELENIPIKKFTIKELEELALYYTEQLKELA